MIWIGIVIGLIIGCLAGVFSLGLLDRAKDDDEAREMNLAYKQGIEDAAEEFSKVRIDGTLLQIARMISSGEIPKDVYDKYLSKTPIGFMTSVEICKEVLKEQMKEQNDD